MPPLGTRGGVGYWDKKNARLRKEKREMKMKKKESSPRKKK
jgi:hypothetical protein